MVLVSREVYEGLEAVRDSGETNMFAREVVAAIAAEDGYYETSSWVMDNKNDYVSGIFEGFEVLDG